MTPVRARSSVALSNCRWQYLSSFAHFNPASAGALEASYSSYKGKPNLNVNKIVIAKVDVSNSNVTERKVSQILYELRVALWNVQRVSCSVCVQGSNLRAKQL